MNKLIRELAREATEYYSNGQERAFDKEKFAELILKQCLSYIEDSEVKHEGDLDYVKFMIERDFGVAQ